MGAFDGDTVKSFLKYTNNKYKRIIAFESSEKNFDSLIKNTREWENIECHNLAVSDSKKTLRFSLVDRKNSFASEEGESTVEADSADNVLNGRKVDYVKMDVEGSEYEAILGMKNTIQTHRPSMAICVYHKVEDLYRLQLLVESFCPGLYKYYLRHYSPTVVETVLYAVPI